VLLGLLSAICYAFRNILIRKHLYEEESVRILLNQLIGAGLLLVPFLLIQEVELPSFPVLGGPMLLNLLALGIIPTAIGHLLFQDSLKKLTAASASIIASLQPLYATCLGIYFLHDSLQWNVVLGGSILIGIVVVESVQKNK
jgi:drug/metabolite transporter (DMT)-like permease